MKKKAFLLLFLGLTVSLPAQFYSVGQSTGAPLDFNLNATPFTTLLENTTADTLSAWVGLPFPFVFFGDTVLAYRASDNGYITFDSTTTTSYPANDLPPTPGGPNNAIYAFWEDLSVPANVGVVDRVKAWTYGAAPNRTHAVQWFSVTPAGTNSYVYCTVLLHECGGFQTLLNWSNASGSTATIGCENQNGTQATVVSGSPNLTVPGLGQASTDDIVYTFAPFSLTGDAGISGFVSPSAAGPQVYTIAVDLNNFGNDTLQNVFVYWAINNGPAQAAYLQPNLPPQASTTINHPIQWTPTGAGTYSLCVWTSLPNGNADPIPCNDTLCQSLSISDFDPTCGTVKVVVLGSSTAAGTGPSTQDSAWVWRYRNYLQSLNPANQVINYGVGGTTTYHIMPDFFIPPSGRPNPNPAQNITLALAQNPDAIIINMPSNDAATGVPASETTANFDSLFSMGNRAGVKVYICTTQPRNFGASGVATQIAVRDYVLNTFGHYALDFWNPFATPGGQIDNLYDSGDGVHMNDFGHRLLNEKVKDKGVAQDILFPVANFDYQNTGSTFQFNDLSENATAWYWDLGDGTLDSTANPLHAYRAAGLITACLIAENACQRDTVCDSFLVCLPPIATLTATDQGNRRFDFSSPTPAGVTWQWDFGDGSYSNLPNPTHIYTTDGTFNVCLTFTDTCAADTVCQSVSVCQAPLAFFTYTTPLPFQVDFTDASQYTTGWEWDFGDGATSSQQNPVHVYAGPGNYTVSLIATNGCDQDTLQIPIILLPSGLTDVGIPEVKLFPNPSQGTARLEGLSGLIVITVTNTLGQEVTELVKFEQAGTDTYQVNGKKLPSGVYYLRIHQEQSTRTLTWQISQ